MTTDVKAFESIIHYTFNDTSLLQKALTHPGMERKKGYAFERLEFLGDRVLGLCVAQSLYSRFVKEKEGLLARRLAKLVCKEKLLHIAKDIHLLEHMKVRQGDLLPNSGVLSDGVEALIGAMYLDGGLDPCERFIDKFWNDSYAQQSSVKDYKSRLQEFTQRRSQGIVSPIYTLTNTQGPDHAPVFCTRVDAEGFGKAHGEGVTKKHAEQEAAKALLFLLQKPKESKK
jgi:ribonuclease-3